MLVLVLSDLSSINPLSKTQNERINVLLVKWLLSSGVSSHQVQGGRFNELTNSLISLGGAKRKYTIPTPRTIRQVSRNLSEEQEILIRSWLHKGCKTASLSVDGVCIYLYTFLY